MKKIKNPFLFLLSLFGGLVTLYFLMSILLYARTKFFIYPNIPEKYTITGEINTPEEAIEVCRNERIYRGPIWEGRIQHVEKSPKTSLLFQIRVIHDLNGDWVVKSSFEDSNSKECFNCLTLLFGPPTASRCLVKNNGRIGEPNIFNVLGIFEGLVSAGH